MANNLSNDSPLKKAILDGNVDLSIDLMTQGVVINLASVIEGKFMFMLPGERLKLIRKKIEEVARLLIKKDADVNVSDSYGQTPLFIAAENINEEVARLLIEKGADVNVSDSYGQTPLFIAARNTNEEVARLLIENGADVNVSGRYGQTPLFIAAENTNEEVARLLIEKGADVNVSDGNGETPLFIAAENTNDEVARLLIEKGADVNVSGSYGQTPLFTAAEYTNEGVARLLIEKGAHVNVSDRNGRTPLFTAFTNEVARLLIENGADVNVSDRNGQTPLFTAYKNEEVARLLIENGADVNVSDRNGRTPLFTAYTNEEVARLLIENGADVNVSDRNGRTPLFTAYTNEEVARLLIEKGADVNVSDRNGTTPLFIAAENTNEEVARLLIKKEADVTASDKRGKTSLFFPARSKNKHVARLLIEEGADINARDIYGRTALLYAVRTCHTVEQFKVIASMLIDKGANLNDTDNHDVSVLSYFIERCCCDEGSPKYPCSPYGYDLEYFSRDMGGLTFFTDNGIKNSTVVSSALTFLYVNLLNHLHSANGVIQEKGKEIFAQALSVASKYAANDDLTCIGNLKALLAKDEIPGALDALMMLGVNPNSADSHGNTALHYATLLPFHGVSQEWVMKILQTLEKHRVRFNVRNQENETPLHFCLSEKAWKPARKNDTRSKIVSIGEICEFLLKDGSLIFETTRRGETVYHLILKLIQKGLSMNDKEVREVVCFNAVKLLELFSKTTSDNFIVLNRMDNICNSPLHLWATLHLPSSENYGDSITKNITFEMFLDKILKHLLTPRVTPNPRKGDDQTPLHLSKTWTATKLLLNAGANANDLDRMRRPPLLNFAKHQEFVNNPRCFFPDVEDDAAPFFEKCVSLGLDIWSSDRDGQSILGILLDSEAYVLANALIEVVVTKCTCKLIFEEMVNTICKDESTSTTWKSVLTEKLITSSKFPSKLNLNDALCHICANIDKLRHQGQGLTIDEEGIESDGPPNKKPRIDDTRDNTRPKWNVFVDIGRQLLFYGADGNSLCKDFPGLCSFLTIKINPGQMKTIIPWTSHSNTHKEKLEIVSRKQDVEKIGTYCFHKEPIGSGSFGDVYAGICENDAREVAIKKIKKSSVLRPVDEREKRVLIELADCQQVVHYISFDDFNNDFVYIVLELMEGHLDDYLASHSVDEVERVNLCKEIIKGMRYLHQHKPKPILHRDLKPTNILYKFDRNGKLCLKIADFGLSSPPTPTTGRTTVLPTKVATRNWIAPEVTRSQPYQYFQSSDVFCCGLLFHYILSKQKHPFSPADCSNKSIDVIVHETQDNMLKYKMEGWDDEISPEANHLIIDMLQQDHGQRPSAADSLCHPFFWSNKKRMEFLRSVGNQTEFECPSTIKATSHHVTPVETDLNSNSAKIVKYGKWDDLNYKGMANVVAEMNKPIVKVNKKGKTYHNKPRTYDTVSVVELVRFIRNAIAHVSEASRPTNIRKLILDDFVFLKEFPHLLIEVYKAVITHGWDKREEIKYAISSYGE